MLAPPGALDAFGAFGGDHLVQDAPPAKAGGRTIGHQRDHILDRLGPRRPPAGPRHLSGLAAKAAHRVPAEFGARGGLRGRGRSSEFRNVTVVGDEPRHLPPAEPRAQPVDEAIEVGLLVAAAKADLFLRAGFGMQHGQPREIEAEARIDLVAERGEAFDEQRADGLRVAHRPRCAGSDTLHRAVGAEQRQLDAACAFWETVEQRLHPEPRVAENGGAVSDDEADSDVLRPRETSALFGHAAAEQALLEAYRAAASRMPG